MQKEAFEGARQLIQAFVCTKKKNGCGTIVSWAVSCPLRFGTMFLSAVLALPVLAVSSKVQQTSGQAGRQGSDTGSRGSCSVIGIGLDCIVHHLPLSSPHPSNTKLVDPQCRYALTSLTLPCPCPHPRNSLSNLCVALLGIPDQRLTLLSLSWVRSQHTQPVRG